MSSTTKLTQHSWAAPAMEEKGSSIGTGYSPAGVTTSSLSKHMMCGKKKTGTIGLSQDLGFETKENSAPRCQRNFGKAT